MRVSNSLDNFQQKMNELFQEFEFIQAYIDDIFILTKGDCTDHVYTKNVTDSKLIGKIGLECDIENYFFGQTKM